MSKYENAMKLLEERCGDGKEVLMALATIVATPDSGSQTRPAARMVCAYYEDGAFYVSTDASSGKMQQIEKNPAVAIAGLDWFSFQAMAENLGWVKDEKNAAIRSKFKSVFDWFDEVGDEDNPSSIILKVTPTEGTITDNEKKYGDWRYAVDFINQTAQ